MDGFFDSLRRMNLPRSQERWIGGVAGGIGARLRIDPLIVRGVFLVITLFGGLGLLVYGLAWALLPEAADGRIHLQEAIRGRFDAALVGAIVFTVIGLSRVGFWWDGWFGIPYMIGMVALVALVVVVVAAVRSSGSSPSSTAQPGQGGSVPFSTTHPGQGGPVPPAAGPAAAPGARRHTPRGCSSPEQTAAGPWADGPWTDAAAAPGAEPHTEQQPDPYQEPGPEAGTSADDVGTAPTAEAPAAHSQHSAWTSSQDTHGGGAADQGAGSTGHGGVPPTPPPPVPAPAPQPPRPPARPGPGRTLVRLTFGLALLAIAALVLAGEYLDWTTRPWLIAFGGALVVIGLGATVAGLLGRRSASLGVVGTLLAIVLVPWAITTNLFSGYNFVDTASYGDHSWTPQSTAEAGHGYRLTAGSLEVDLSDLVEETVTTPIEIDMAAGEVTLLVPDGMPVTVTATGQGEITALNLDDWTAEVDGEPRTLSTHTDFGWIGTRPLVAELTSPEAAETEPIEVNIDVAFGSINIREVP